MSFSTHIIVILRREQSRITLLELAFVARVVFSKRRSGEFFDSLIGNEPISIICMLEVKGQVNKSIILSLDSRNELMRVAVNGILQRGEGGKGRDHGNQHSNSSVSDSPHQVSSASTLRDTESIREVMPVA